MVFSADDLVGWRDFPKGLRVLLLDEDGHSKADIKSKLEQMDYIGINLSTFCNVEEALDALAVKDQSFHVAIVEVNMGSSNGGLLFLEQAKNLPTMMVSNVNCLSTMMKCIALGAAEFLLKPLSEDKLRNIWQHVVHKAFNAGGTTPLKSLEPIKEIVASMLQLEQKEAVDNNQTKAENAAQSPENEQYPAPSTPQLERGRSSGDGDATEQETFSIKLEGNDQEVGSAQLRKLSLSDSKSVENTNNNSFGETSTKEESYSGPGQAMNDDEVDSREGSKLDEYHTYNGSSTCSDLQEQDDQHSVRKKRNHKEVLDNHHSCSPGPKRKKIKVDWTPDLHKRFVQAVEQLGMDQAIPSKILEMMKVEGLTRHNVASHLQKYRMHRRHILPKEGERKWLPPPIRDPLQRTQVHKPVMAYPSYQTNYSFPAPPIFPAWGQPVWGSPSYSSWHPPGSWPWKSCPPMHVDAWGCPVMPSQAPPYSVPHQLHSPTRWPGVANEIHGGRQPLRSFYDSHPAEEVIDKVVKEVINQPWLPLPLGLKPPSTESVLYELHRQGAAYIPPHCTSR